MAADDTASAPAEFERPPHRGKIGFFVLLWLSVVTVSGGILMLILGGDGLERWYVGGVLLVGGALVGSMAVFMRKSLLRPYRVRFLPSGVSVELEGEALEVPWSAIEAWDMADHKMRGKSMPMLGLCAYPAPGVNPVAGGLDRLWSNEDGCWVLCEPKALDRSAAEITAAAQRFAADKYRAPRLPRA